MKCIIDGAAGEYVCCEGPSKETDKTAGKVLRMGWAFFVGAACSKGVSMTAWALENFGIW